MHPVPAWPSPLSAMLTFTLPAASPPHKLRETPESPKPARPAPRALLECLGTQPTATTPRISSGGNTSLLNGNCPADDQRITMISITDRRIVVSALMLLTALSLPLAFRHGSAAASCETRTLTNAPERAVAARRGEPHCEEPSTVVADAGASRLAVTPSGSATAAPAGQIDILAPLRFSILQGSSLLPQAPVRLTPRLGSFRWPVAGPITQPFGVPELGVGLPHTGLDIGQDAGTPIRAAEAGRVVFAGGDPCCGLGYWVEINHGDRYSTRYGHFMRPPVVLAGDYVTQGQVLGFSGNIGFSTGPHLHFEVRFDGIPIDPLRVLPAR
jgi:hypothetical protein